MLAVSMILSLCPAGNKLSSRSRFLTTFATALTGVIVCGITYCDNRTVIEKYNVAEHYHRQIIEDALKKRADERRAGRIISGVLFACEKLGQSGILSHARGIDVASGQTGWI